MLGFDTGTVVDSRERRYEMTFIKPGHGMNRSGGGDEVRWWVRLLRILN